MEKSKASLAVTIAEMHRLQELANTEAENDIIRRNIGL